MIRIVTDGACSGNPGPGGWAALIIGPSVYEEIGDHERHTTNNRMELRAALEALRHVPPNVPVRIVTDSQYLIKGMTEWLAGWKRRGWRTAKGKPVENQSLWQELEPLAGDRVTWEHVRGHTGHPENERANTLAQAYALGKQPPRQPPDPIVHQPRETPPPVVPKSPNNQPLNLDGISRPSGKTYLSLVNGQLARHTTWEECSARTNGVSGAKPKKCKSLDEEIAVVKGWGLSPDALRELTTTTTTNQPTSSVPHVHLLCREFLPVVSHLLAKAGFTRQDKAHSHSLFRMEHQKAIVEAYTNGKIQRQGEWAAADERVWQALPQVEDKWLTTQLAALNISTAPQIAWNKEICGDLWRLLVTDRLPGWTAEQIGRYLFVRDVEGGPSKGILAPDQWRTPPKAPGEIALWEALTTAHRRPDRWCAARVQGQNGQLSIAVLPLTPAAQFMAKARHWRNGHKVAKEEQKRLLSQIKSRLLFFCERWTKETWHKQAQAQGNQLDFLYDWLAQTISANTSKLNIPLTRPLDLIMKPIGNEEWGHRLLSQRTNGRIHFCVPKLPEEIDAYQLAHFLARSACAKETNSE